MANFGISLAELYADTGDGGADTEPRSGISLDEMYAGIDDGQGLPAPKGDIPDGRLLNSLNAATQGAMDIPAGVAKSVGISSFQTNQGLNAAFDAIDNGQDLSTFPASFEFSKRNDLPPQTAQHMQVYSRMDQEQRKEYRARFERLDSPKDTGAYQAGEGLSDWTRSNFPENPEYQDEFVASKLPRGLGSTVGFMGTTLASLPLGGVPALATTAFVGAGAEKSAMFEDALQNGADLGQALEASDYGAWIGTTEAVPIAPFLSRLDKITGGGAKRLVVDALKQGTEEAIQEASQSILENLVANDIVAYDKERGTFTGAGEGAGVGFTAGVLYETIGGLVMGRHSRSASMSKPAPTGKREQAAQQAPELSEADRASPIPDDLIQQGKSVVQDGEATRSANDILRSAGVPQVNTKVSVQVGDKMATGTIVDAYEDEQAGSGVKMHLDDGSNFSATFEDISSQNIQITPVSTPQAPMGTKKGDVSTQMGEGGQQSQFIASADIGTIKTATGADIATITIGEGDEVRVLTTEDGRQIAVMGADSEAQALSVARSNRALGMDEQAQAMTMPILAFKDMVETKPDLTATDPLDDPLPADMQPTNVSRETNQEQSQKSAAFDPATHYGAGIRYAKTPGLKLTPLHFGKEMGLRGKEARDVLDVLAARGVIRKTDKGYSRIPVRKGPVDMLTFIADHGGLRDDEGHDLKARRNAQRLIPGVGALIRSNGMGIDAAGERLHEAGYFGPMETTPRPTEAQVLEVLDRALAGNKTYVDEEAHLSAEARANTDSKAAVAEVKARVAEIGLDLEGGDIERASSWVGQGVDVDEAIQAAVEHHSAEWADEHNATFADDSVDIPWDEIMLTEPADLEAGIRYNPPTVAAQMSGAYAAKVKNNEPRTAPQDGQPNQGSLAQARPQTVTRGGGRGTQERPEPGNPRREDAGQKSPGVTADQTNQAPADNAGVSDSGVEYPSKPPVRTYGYDAVKMSDNLSLEELSTLREWLVNDPANENPIRKNGGSAIHLYDKKTHQRLDKLAWAVTYKLAEKKKAQQSTTETVTNVDGATEQGVIPGAEKIGDKELAERKMAEKMKAKASQKDAGSDGGLFDTGARDQVDMFDAPKAQAAPAKKTASWVIREKATGKVIMETFDRAKVDALNTEKYEAVPILEHLVGLNQKSEVESNKGSYTLEEHDAVIDRIFSGDITADELKATFKRLKVSEESVMAELQKLTKKQLEPMVGLRFSNEKKDRMVKSAFDGMLMKFSMGDSITYSPFSGETMADAVARNVEKVTDEDIQKQAKQLAERRAEFKQTYTDPQTLEQFSAYMRVRGEDALSPEQKARYDELVAERNRARGQVAKEQKATIKAVDIGDVAMEMVETTHTKKGYPLFVVKVAERVDKDTYKDMLSKAKRLGGWYSSYKVGDAVPGYQFKDKESAEKFMSLKEGDVSNLDQVEAREANVKGNAVQRLRAMAENLDGKAEDSLGADRKTNTAKRAREAGYAEEKARADKALAETMRNLADAIERGDAKNLDGIRTKSHVEAIDSMLRQAKYAWARKEAKKSAGSHYEELTGRPFSEEHVAFAELPVPYAHRDTAMSLARQMENTPGLKIMAKRLINAAEDAQRRDEWRVVGDTIAKQEMLSSIAAGALKKNKGDYQAQSVLDTFKDANRMKTMGIPDLPTLRAALREYIQYRGKKAKADPVTLMERDLVGNKSVGVDFFPTPPAVLERIMEEADITYGMRVLEPSAGKGDIADAAKAAGAEVDTIELSGTLRNILEAKGHHVIDHDFETFEGGVGQYDRVVMNPPFSDRLDAQHVQKAYDMVKPGGRLVAIMGEGVFFGSDKKATAFRDWLDNVGGTSEQLPEGSFKSSFRPTGVATRLVVIDKTSDDRFSVFNDPDWTGVAPGLDWKGQAKIVEVKKQYEEIEDASDVRRLANQEISAPDGILGEYQNLDTGWDIHLYAKGIRKTLSGEGSKIRAALAWKLPDLLKNAILVETVSDKKTRADINRIHRFYAAAQMDGDVRRIKITVREHNDGVRRQYDIDHLDIEKPGTGLSPSNDRTTGGVGSIPLPGSAISIRQLLDNVNSEVDGKPVMGRGESHAIIAEYDWKTSVDREQLVQKVITISKRIAPKVKVQVVDELLGNVPGRGSIPVTGVHRAAQNLIEVAVDLGNPEKTIRHEGIHALKSMGLFSDTEWSILAAKARREWQGKYKIDDLYPMATKEQKIEEAIAQASAEYGYGKGTFPPGIRRILDKIKQFFERLSNALKGMGYQSAEDIFDRVESGKVGNRESASNYRDGAAGDKYMAAAYHGSPHDFDAFSTNNIGTGEGAQAYGWGLYFAGKKEVAEFYRDKLTEEKPHFAALSDKQNAVLPVWVAQGASGKFSSDTANKRTTEILSEFKRREKDADEGVDLTDIRAIMSALEELQSSNNYESSTSKGRLFHVELAPQEDEYLLWDKPLSEQSEKVKRAVRKVQLTTLTGMYPLEAVAEERDWSGEQIYKEIAQTDRFPSYEDASKYLHSLGVPGIKYMDGDSRNRPLRDIKRSFLEALPEDSDTQDVADMIGDGTFSAQQDKLLQALEADDWLGFDYPSQAISAALSKNVHNWDPSQSLLDAIAELQADATYNYVIFDDSLVTVTDKYSLFDDGAFDNLEASRSFADGATDGAATAEQKQSALSNATKSLKEFVTAPALPDPKDLNWFSMAIVHPRTIASIYPKFTGVWLAAEKQFKRRDTINAELTRILEPYLKLDLEGKELVHKVLEICRLEGGSIDSPMVGVTNKLGTAALTKKGDKISLNKEQSEAYHAVRACMDRALDMYKERVLREWGYGKDGDPATSKELEAHAKALFEEAKKTAEPEDAKDMRREADDARQLAQLIAEIEQAKADGYVPFTRFGDMSISVRDSMGGVVHFEKIEVGGLIGRLTDRKKVNDVRKRLMAQYPKSKGYDVEEPRRMVNANDLAAAGIKIGDVDALAELARVEGPEWDPVRKQLNEASKKIGFRKHFIGAKNTPGYSTDFERSIPDYVTGISSYLARREVRDEMDTALAQIPQLQTRLKKYAQSYDAYIQSPKEVLQWLRSLNFFFYLSGRLDSAMVNLTQVPLATMPYLNQFASAGKVSIEIGRAYKDLAKMALQVPTRNGGAIEFFDLTKAPADVREDMLKAGDDGTLVPLVTMEQMGVAHGSEKFRRGFSKGTRVGLEFAGSLFTGAERANRIVTFIAAHRLARQAPVRAKMAEVLKDNTLWQRMAKDMDPGKFAEWTIDETHFVLGKRNRPTLFRGIGTTIFQFRSFTVNFLELMWRMSKQNGPEGKKAMAMVMGGLLASAGVWGLPFGDDLKDIFEAIYAWATDKEIDLESELRLAIHDMTGSSVAAEAVSRGTLRMTGADVSRRLGMGNILPTESLLSIFGVDSRNPGEVFGVPLDMTVGRIKRIAENLKNGETVLAASEALPSFAKNWVQAGVWSADGVKSGGAVRIPKEELSDLDVVMKFVGFTPTSVTRKREREWSVVRANTALSTMTSRYYKQLARAVVNGDREKLVSLRQNIAEYNAGRGLHDQIVIYPPSLKKAVRAEAMGYDARLGKGPRKTRARAADLREAYPD